MRCRRKTSELHGHLSLATTRAGKPILPSGFREPSGGFRKTTSADAERWIASSMTTVPGRDRADVVSLRTDAELANASKAKSFAKALVSSVGASPRIVTNMTFSGSWSDVTSGGSMFQGMVLVIGSKGAALVYSDASD